MAEWKPVGPETLLADGQMAEVQVGEERVLLARVDGKYYAAQALCPHLNGRLSRGTLNGTVVTCPVHGSQFDLQDGHCVAWVAGLTGLVRKAAQAVKKPRGLQIHATRLTDGQVWVAKE